LTDLQGVAQWQQILFAATEVEEDFPKVSTSPQFASCTSIPGAGASVRDLEDFVDRLPRNSHLDKFRKKQREHERDSNADLKSSPHEEEDKKVHEMSTLSNQLSEYAIIEEGEEEDEDDEQYEEDPATSEVKHGADGSEAGLKIAWQYSKSIQDERAGMKSSGSQSNTSTTGPPLEKNVFCHSFDLSGRLVNQYDGADGSLDLSLGEESQSHPHPDVPIPNQPVHVVNCCGDEFAKTNMDNARIRGFVMFRRILAKLRTLLERRYTSPNTSSPVVRLVFLNPPLPECAVYLPLLMSTIRQEQLSVVVMMTIQPWLYYGDSSSSSTDCYPSYVRTKRACADAAFSVQGFAGLLEPPATEFRSLAGLLLVERLNNMALSTFSPRRPPANKYGLKRDRRKLHMNLLHLPPEDYSAGGSSISGGGVRSGGGKDNPANSKSTSSAPLANGTACGSGMKGGATLLDF
jgi:hypothetical protein